MKGTHKKLLALLLSALLLFSLAGCGQETTAGEQTESETPQGSEQEGTGGETAYKPELIVGVEQDVTTLDPQNQNEIAAGKVVKLIYNRLAAIDLESGEVLPELAESWEQLSDTEWRFKLREGVKFHNGNEMTAEDVVYSIQRAMDSARVKTYFSDIEEVRAEGDYEVYFKLNKPSVVFLSNLAHNGGSIIPKDSGDGIADEPIGTGPYKFKEWVPSDYLTVERFDDFYGGAKPTQLITMRVIPEASSRVIALETGEIDVAESVQPIDVSKVSNNSALSMLQTPSVGIEYVGFHLEKAPFDNKLVRQALSHAVNKQAIVDAVLQGQGVVAKTVMGPGIPGYYDGMEGFDYNPEKAKELLAQAGYPEGFEFTLYITGSERVLSSQLLQADFNAIGVTMEIEQFESSALFDAVNNGRHQAYILTWSNNTGDPHNSVNNVFHSSNHGATGNRMWYTNEKVDELIEQGAMEFDNEKRMEIYKEIQEIVVDDAVWIPLYYKTVNVGVKAGVKGVVVDPGSFHYYADAYCEI